MSNIDDDAISKLMEIFTREGKVKAGIKLDTLKKKEKAAKPAAPPKAKKPRAADKPEEKEAAKKPGMWRARAAPRLPVKEGSAGPIPDPQPRETRTPHGSPI